jgi:hypothetical protein
MTNAQLADSIGKTFALALPAQGNGIPEHWRNYRVRVLEPLRDGYAKCMMVAPWGDTHTALVHHKQILPV